MPWLILICGPNGAGKSTFAGGRLFLNALAKLPGGPAKIFNPDEFAKVYFAANPRKTWTDANLWAANQVPLDVARCIDNGENVTIETVLSSGKYEPIIRRARRKGYQVGMVYLALESAAASKGRVAQRVASGGHDVPEDRIRPRWRRSLDNLVKFAPLLDELVVYLSTSKHGLVLLAQKLGGPIYWYGGIKFPSLHLRLGAQKPPKSGPVRGGILPLT